MAIFASLVGAIHLGTIRIPNWLGRSWVWGIFQQLDSGVLRVVISTYQIVGSVAWSKYCLLHYPLKVVCSCSIVNHNLTPFLLFPFLRSRHRFSFPLWPFCPCHEFRQLEPAGSGLLHAVVLHHRFSSCDYSCFTLDFQRKRVLYSAARVNDNDYIESYQTTRLRGFNYYLCLSSTGISFHFTIDGLYNRC
jgi:hypothetical protein